MANRNEGLETRGVVSKMPVCDNIADTAIRITESKARLVYRDYLKRCSGERVISSLSLFITVLVTLLTTSFNDALGIENSKYTLQAFFVFLAITLGIATVVFFIKWRGDKKQNNEDAFINALKGYRIL